MKKLLIHIITLCLSANSFAQQVHPQWTKTFGNIANRGEEGKTVATDNAGNIYVAGTFSGKTSFGTHIIQSDKVKIEYGDYKEKPYLGKSSDVISEEIVTRQGEFDVSENDIFLVKYNANREAQWAVRMGGIGDSTVVDDITEWVGEIKVSGTSIYMVGSFLGNMNFSSPFTAGVNEITSMGGKDIFLASFSTTDGSLQWAKRAGGVSNDEGNGIALSSTNIFICGGIKSIANFNTPAAFGSNEITSAVENTVDAFFAKYDLNGNFLLAKRAGGDNNDMAQKIETDGTSIFMCGYFKTSANFNNPSSTGANELTATGLFGGFGNGIARVLEDYFLAKYDNNGALQWAKRAGTSYAATYVVNGYTKSFFQNDISMVLSIENSITNVYVSSNYNSFLSGGTYNLNTPSSSSSNTLSGNGIFLAKFNDVGSLVWVKTGKFMGSAWYLKFEGLGKIGNNFYVIADYSNNGRMDFQKLDGSTVQLDRRPPNSSYLYDFNNPFYAKYQSDLNLFIAQYQDNGEFISASFLAEPYINLNTGNPKYPSELYHDYAGYQDYEPSYIFSGNDLYMTGGFDGTTLFLSNKTDGSNIITSSGGTDFFLAKSRVSNGTPNGSSYNLNSMQWALSEGHPDRPYNKGLNSITDSDGNLYVGGVFTGKITFGNFTLKSAGGRDIFLVKYNSSGIVQWAKRCGGITDDAVGSLGSNVYLAISASEIYISTNVWEDGFAVNFNTPSSFSTNSYQNSSRYIGATNPRKRGITTDSFSFLGKFTTNGDFLWAKTYEGGIISDIATYGTSVYFLALIDKGIYVGDAFVRTDYSNYTPEVYESMGGSDVALVKLNSNGDTQWIRRMGGLSTLAYANKVVADFSGIYITGQFTSEFGYGDPNSPLLTQAGTNSFLAQINTSGSLLWVKRIPGSNENVTRSQLVINNNSIFVTNKFKGTINFNSPSTPGSNELSTDNPSDNENYEHFIAKFSKTNGAFQWAKRTDATIMGLAANNSAVYFCGQFENTANFKTPYTAGVNEITSTGGKDMFISKMDVSGNLAWIKQGGSNGTLSDEFASGISLYETNIYFTGQLAGYLGKTKNIDMSFGGDPNIINNKGHGDIFVSRLFEGSLTTNALSGSSFCAGTNISVPFTASGYFETGYKVQISNASGVFPVKIGYIGTSTTEDPIVATLPANAVGTNYKVRVISTNPDVEGTATPLFGGFTIVAASNGGTVTGGTTVCTGTNSTTLTLTGKLGNVLKWQQSVNNTFTSPTDIAQTTTSINISNLTADRYYRAVVQNSTCPTANSAFATMVVSPLSVGGNPSSLNGIFCSGINNNTINLTGNVGSVTKWQSSPSSTFTSPVDITNTTASLNVTNINTSTYYRAVVKNGACAEANSSGRQIAVSNSPVTLTSSFPLNNITYPVKSNFIITGQNSITGSSNVLYRSNQAVDLKNGFLSETGTVFKAELGACN